MTQLTDDEKIKLANHWAHILQLKRSKVNPNRFITLHGMKTPLDLYATITWFVIDKDGTLKKLKVTK